MLKNMLGALCLIAFTTGCVKTKTVVVERKIATVPPAYLYDSEPIPNVPESASPEERVTFLLEAYASRGDALRRDQEQADLMRRWIEGVKNIFPETIVQPLEELESDADDPK